MYNHVGIMGRFVRDPECSTTQSGILVARFTLACDRDFKNKETGERETDFIDFVAWRHTAEFVRDNFRKGRAALAEGRIQVSSWVDKDGNKRWRTEVKADNVYFADSKRPSDEPPSEGSQPEYPVSDAGQDGPPDPPEPDSIMDSLPF